MRAKRRESRGFSTAELALVSILITLLGMILSSVWRALASPSRRTSLAGTTHSDPRNCDSSVSSLVSASMILGGHTAMWSILSVGLFNSIMFPTIFSLGVAELGPLTGSGSGILTMAIVGGAVLPVIQGVIADHVGIHHAFFLPLLCYLYILFYGLNGSKPNSARYAKG